MAIVGLLAVLVVVIVVFVSNAGGGGDNNGIIIVDSGITHSSPQEGAVIGQPNAPLTMIEYFRFDCSHCADYARQTAPQIEKDYVDTGKLRIEERALALSGDIMTASEAALCAGDQNHYFDYYDLVFANQTLGFSLDNLKQYARKLNLDTGAFDTCLNSKKYEQSVIDDTNRDVQAGINSTPTFFIGGTKAIEAASVPYTGFTQVPGAQPYSEFKKAIDAELAKAQ